MWLPDIPSTLPGIIGLGAGTSIGAQLVTSVRGPKGSGQEKPSLSDFITSGGVAAPERVQMFVWTTVGVLGFCLATLRANPWEISGLPEVGTGLRVLRERTRAGRSCGRVRFRSGGLRGRVFVSCAGLANGLGESSRRARSVLHGLGRGMEFLGGIVEASARC